MGSQPGQAMSMEKYIYRATAVAAHFHFTDGQTDFGDAQTLVLASDTPEEQLLDTGSRSGPEISFTGSSVYISFTEDPAGVYTTIAKSTLTNFNANDVLTADSIQSGMMTVYRKDWYGDPNRARQARVLPLPPVLTNLKIYGVPFRIGQELQLPEPFSYTDAQRAQYFGGAGADIDPIGISPAPGGTISTPQGNISISADTRKLDVPNFGTVYIADWTLWQPPADAYPASSGAQWVELVRLDLGNPGKGGGGGAGGDGSPFP